MHVHIHHIFIYHHAHLIVVLYTAVISLVILRYVCTIHQTFSSDVPSRTPEKNCRAESLHTQRLPDFQVLDGSLVYRRFIIFRKSLSLVLSSARESRLFLLKQHGWLPRKHGQTRAESAVSLPQPLSTFRRRSRGLNNPGGYSFNSFRTVSILIFSWWRRSSE